MCQFLLQFVLQKVLSLLRKEPSNVQSSDPKGSLSQLPDTYDLTTEKVRTQPTQKPSLACYSLDVALCVLEASQISVVLFCFCT